MGGVQGHEGAAAPHLQLQDLFLHSGRLGFQGLALLLLLPCSLRLLHQLLADLAQLLPELGQLCILPARVTSPRNDGQERAESAPMYSESCLG